MKDSPPESRPPSGPHADQPVLSAGLPLKDARAALILLHGRGASAESILPLAEELNASQCAILAPQAANHTWYPHSFLAPLQANQPWLDSALERLEFLITNILSAGIPAERIILLGFSQGACLTLEYSARHPRRYGEIIAFTGGLIGPSNTPRNYPGSLAGTPIFLGSGDPDPHVPFQRVEESQKVLTQMGAIVDLRRYPGMPHTINHDELQAARSLVEQATKPK